MSPYGSPLAWPVLILPCAGRRRFWFGWPKGPGDPSGRNCVWPWPILRARKRRCAPSCCPSACRLHFYRPFPWLTGILINKSAAICRNARRAFSCSISARSKLMMCCVWRATSLRLDMIEQAAMLRGQVLSLKGIAAADYNAPPEAAWVLRGDRGLTYAAAPARWR